MEARQAINEEAIEHYTLQIANDPNNCIKYFYRGAAHQENDQYGRAVADYTRALSLYKTYYPETERDWRNIGSDSNRRELAIAANTFKKEYESGIYFARGVCYFNLKHYDEAFSDLERAINLDPRHAASYYFRGLIHKIRTQLENAIEDFKHAIRLHPIHIGAHVNLASVYYDQERFEEAIAEYNHAIGINREDPTLYLRIGLVHEKMGNLNRAISSYRQAISLNENYIRAYYRLALAHYNNQNDDEAIANYSRIIELKPKEANAYYYRGIVRKKQRNLEEALSDFKRATKLSPNNNTYKEKYDALRHHLANKNKNSQTKASSSTKLRSKSSQSKSVSSQRNAIERIHVNDVRIETKIGQGGFGEVFKAQWKENDVAVKQYLGTRLPERVLAEVRHEANIMFRLNHDCLVKLHGIIFQEHLAPMLVMEYMANGSLYNHLHSNAEINWQLRLSIALDVARGLDYLHKNNPVIIHADLKSLNILLDERFNAKLTDFGLSRLKSHSSTTSTNSSQPTGGTVRWMAPELFLDDDPRPSKATDIWALGMVFFEIASRLLPFQNLSKDMQVTVKLMQGKTETVPEDCPAEFGSMMQHCWAERSERPSARELVNSLSDFIASQQTTEEEEEENEEEKQTERLSSQTLFTSSSSSSSSMSGMMSYNPFA